MSTEDAQAGMEPAFPTFVAIGPSGDAYPGFYGMTLRDWFAGQTLASLPLRDWSDFTTGADKIKAWAQSAYAVADAMLAERSK